MADLFEAAAERLALKSGRPKSQELLEVRRVAALAMTEGLFSDTARLETALTIDSLADDPCADCPEVICDRCDCPRMGNVVLDVDRIGEG